MCIHETKLGYVDNWIVSSICDNSVFGYFFQPSVGEYGLHNILQLYMITRPRTRANHVSYVLIYVK